jgi:hypothetical protein
MSRSRHLCRFRVLRPPPPQFSWPNSKLQSRHPPAYIRIMKTALALIGIATACIGAMIIRTAQDPIQAYRGAFYVGLGTLISIGTFIWWLV